MDSWIIGFLAVTRNPFIQKSIQGKKPMACLRRPSGTKPNSEEERQQNARRIPADLTEEGAPSREAEDAGQYRILFCNCCMAVFEHMAYQASFQPHWLPRGSNFA